MVVVEDVCIFVDGKVRAETVGTKAARAREVLGKVAGFEGRRDGRAREERGR